MRTFKTGETYTAKSICDANCIFSFKVVKRTAKRITVIDDYNELKTVGVSIYDNGETAFPLGKYSMAPIIRA